MEKQTTYKNSAGFRCLQNIKKATNDLYLVHCGEQQCPPGYTYNHKIPNENHLHFVLSGKGILIVNDRVHYIKKDDIFLIPQGCPVQYYADEAEPWCYMWVTFAGENAEKYLKCAGLSKEVPVIHSTVPNKTYLNYVQKILEANELTFSNEIRRVGVLYELLATLIDAQASVLHKKGHHDYPYQIYVDHALQYIRDNYSTIKVNDIADYIGINRSYLTSIFKKEVNVSPQEYLLQYRLKKAAQMLRNTNLSVQEIAESVGYENPLTFSKIFKQTYGLSPKNYRNQSLQEES